MAYIGSSPTKVVSRQSANIFTYTATANQTAFTGSDANGNTLACTPSDIMVHMNGIKLEESDYTASTTTVTLGSGAAAGDEVTITAFVTFETADAYTKSASDTRYVNATGDNMSGALTVDVAAATPLTVDRATSDGTIIDVQKDGTSVATIGNSGSAGIIILNKSASSGVGLFGSTNNGGCLLPTNNTTAVDNAKDLGRSDVRWRNLYLSSGAYLGGTTSANKLEDYEEGTWTPTIHGGGSFSIQNATYTKIGKLVYAGFYANNTTGVTSTGQFFISLPFAVSPSNNYHGVGTVSYVGTANWAQYDISGPTPYSQQALMYFHKLSGSASALTNSEFQIMNGKPFIMGLVYHTDS
tara:strand:- start:1070 stop:2131 length:1062 start_codon:yes stop_codon:yes gene_type:complete